MNTEKFGWFTKDFGKTITFCLTTKRKIIEKTTKPWKGILIYFQIICWFFLLKFVSWLRLDKF